MAKVYNIQWQEICNLEIIAESRIEAEYRWVNGAYEENQISRNSLDKPEITIVEHL